MHTTIGIRTRAVSLLFMVLLVSNYGVATLPGAAAPPKAHGAHAPERNAISSAPDLYNEEAVTCYIEAWSDNVTSPGVEDAKAIVGIPDGLQMRMGFPSESEYALLKVNGSIMSDMLVLKAVVDEGAADTILEVYTWNDPYVSPNSKGFNVSMIDPYDWCHLGDVVTETGDVVLEYANCSIEYVLLVGHSSVSNPTYYYAVDAVEVHGHTNVMADTENDGIPDIWQNPSIEMYNMTLDVDMHGHTFGIMGLVGVAAESATNQEFLMPFVKLGIIDYEDIDESHYYVICQTELTLPFPSPYEYMTFLGSHDLLNMTIINGNATVQAAFFDAFSHYIAHDHRVRNYHLIDYTVEGTFDPHNYFACQHQIDAKYTTLNTVDTTTDVAEEKFDLDISIVLDIAENVLDAVKRGADFAEQFMKKIIGFIQGKMLDGIKKALLEKITKKALKSFLKVVFSVTTVKDIVVKGIKILEKLEVPIPSWLKRAREIAESIPVIDPPVEIWKVRLTFVNETTGLPVLGYDFINNKSIESHPKGLYFGDTYSAQVILSSRDIFPVVGRIQSVNGSRTLTGHLYIEDFALQEATHARSSLQPGEYARGRIYPTPPRGSIVISQCHITLNRTLPFTVELGTAIPISLVVTDENGTQLTDASRACAAINNLPHPMIELPVTAQANGTLTTVADTGSLGIKPGDYMIAAVYKPAAMFHDYWNYTFVLQDTTPPSISTVTAPLNTAHDTVVVSADVSDHDLNTSSVLLGVMDGSPDPALAVLHGMTFNGTLYVATVNVTEFSSDTIYYFVSAADRSGNTVQSPYSPLQLSTTTTTTTGTTTTTNTSSTTTTPTDGQVPLWVFIVGGAAGLAAVALIVYVVRRPH